MLTLNWTSCWLVWLQLSVNICPLRSLHNSSTFCPLLSLWKVWLLLLLHCWLTSHFKTIEESVSWNRENHDRSKSNAKVTITKVLTFPTSYMQELVSIKRGIFLKTTFEKFYSLYETMCSFFNIMFLKTLTKTMV